MYPALQQKADPLIQFVFMPERPQPDVFNGTRLTKNISVQVEVPSS